MRKLLISLVLISLLVTSTVMVAVAQGPTEEPTGWVSEEPTEEPTVEPTEEPTAEPTEEPTVEPTEEPTAEPTEEPTVEPTVEPTEAPTPEPTEEPTVEPTEEPTLEPTEEPTEEPTAEPTEEPTEEPTVEPTEEPTPEVGASGEVEAQAYSGTWTTYVRVQNMGTGQATIGIDWYQNGASSWCAQTSGETLQPGAAKSYSLPSACGTTGWIGSAVVSGGEPLAAVAETYGSVGDLFSQYVGASQGSTEPLIILMINNENWDPMVGISNVGSGTANVKITLLNRDGTTFSDPNNPYNVSIPSQSGVQVSVRNDITTAIWGGTIKIENDGTNEPLYAVLKAERDQSPYLPISISLEAFRETSDASSEWVLPVLSRNSIGSAAFDTINGMNQGIAFQNPSGTNSVNVTVEFYNTDGSLVTTWSTTLNPNGVWAIATFQVAGIPASWGGTGRVTAVVQGTSTPAPIFVDLHHYYAIGSTVNFTSWAAYSAYAPASGAHQVFLPAARKGSTTIPPGSNWRSGIYVTNLHSTNATRVNIELINESGTVLYSPSPVDIAANGRYGLDLTTLGSLGTNFNGGARFTVETGYPDTIVALGSNGFGGYPTGSDSLGIYNGVSD